MADVHRGLTHAMLVTRTGRYALLAVLVADVFAIPPLVATGALPYSVQGLSFSLVCLVAVVALAAHVSARWLVVAVALVAVAARWGPIASHVPGFRFLEAATVGLAAATFAGVLLVEVFSNGQLQDRLLSVVLVYVLLGVAWAFAYGLVLLVHPGALQGPEGVRHVSQLLYFSFSTLTTVGYGDIAPLHPYARTLAVLEALTGQLFLVVVVSRFVGASASGSSRK